MSDDRTAAPPMLLDELQAALGSANAEIERLREALVIENSRRLDALRNLADMIKMEQLAKGAIDEALAHVHRLQSIVYNIDPVFTAMERATPVRPPDAAQRKVQVMVARHFLRKQGIEPDAKFTPAPRPGGTSQTAAVAAPE